MAVTPEDEQALDALLADVHGKIDMHIAKVKATRRTKKKTSTKRHKKTRMAFQAMVEDVEEAPFSLEDSREIAPEDAEALLREINGAAPAAPPSYP